MSPFVEGYKAAILAELKAPDAPFSPSALALILKDCEDALATKLYPDCAAGGRLFYVERQGNSILALDRFRDRFPPLLPSLDEEGKVQLSVKGG